MKKIFFFLFISGFVFVHGQDFRENAANSMFRVGLSGTSPSLATILQVIGGNYKGRNAGIVGSFLDAYNTTGVQLVGVYAARFTNLIQTAASVSNYAIQCSGIQFNSITTNWNDITKLSGYLDVQAVNAATGPI